MNLYVHSSERFVSLFQTRRSQKQQKNEHKEIINPYLSRVFEVIPSISIKWLSTYQ